MRIAMALVRAEAIKLRRTSIPTMAVIAAILASVTELVNLLDSGGGPPDLRPPAVIWQNLLQGHWALWLVFFVPMLIALEAASLANLEHSGNQWKQLFTCPLPRWTIYATKMLFCGALVSAGFVVSALGFIVDGLIFSGLHGLHLASAIPWFAIAALTGKAALACWLPVVIQSWLSARFSGFGIPIGIAFAALLFGFMMIGERLNAIVSWYPWMLPFGTQGRANHPDNTVLPVVFGCVGGIVAGIFACRDLARRRDQG